MTAPIRIRDFDREKFSIIAYCQECRHSATLNLRLLEPELTIPDFIRRLRCTDSRATMAARKNPAIFTNILDFRVRVLDSLAVRARG